MKNLPKLGQAGIEQKAFSNLHERGAKNWGLNWLKMNLFIIDAASSHLTNSQIQQYRLMLSEIAYKVLVNIKAFK